MSLRRGQAGAVGALLLAILVIVMAVLVAMQVLSRVSDVGQEEANAAIGLERARSALEAYAGTAQRLPCPAKPDVDTGLEVINTPTKCSFPEGTLPWKTIGLRRDDAIDPWGRKLSYRVYSGGGDSLTQPGGVSMVNCDTSDIGPTVGNLCKAGATVYDRDTSPANFLAGKGYTLTEAGKFTVLDVAYVILSHGSTGLGGYTVSGARLDMPHPAGDEGPNTNADGPFMIAAHSDNDMEASKKEHFDDLLVYRRLGDLIKRIGLDARDWPELGAGSSSVSFDAATVSAAVGSTVAPGDTGRNTLTFPGAQVSGESGTSTPTNLTYDTAGGSDGIGVAGGGSTAIQSSANEFIRIDFAEGWKRFGITLNDFGTYSATYTEKVELRFYVGNVAVGSAFVGLGCHPDGGQASFTVPVDATFDRVDIVPMPANNSSGPAGITAFLIDAVIVCSSTSTACRTSFDTAANRCP